MSNHERSGTGVHLSRPVDLPPKRKPRVMAAWLGGAVLSAGLMVGAGVAALHAFNPVGDEWVCSQGEAPAGNSCYPQGAELPPGVRWDPLGNRPLSHNCDKDGWVQIAPDDLGESDCIREGAVIPGGWHIVRD